MWTDLLENEIEKLEKQINSYSTCAKLADLYIIKDHCQCKDDFIKAYENFKEHKESKYLIVFLNRLKEMIENVKRDFPKEIENFLSEFSKRVDLEIKK